MTIKECFCNCDSDYLSYLVNLFSRNPNRLHYESNFLNDMNFLQSTNFLGIWACNLPRLLLVTSGDTAWHQSAALSTEDKQSQAGARRIWTLKLRNSNIHFLRWNHQQWIIFILIRKYLQILAGLCIFLCLDITYLILCTKYILCLSCQFSSYLNNVCHSFPLISCNVQCSVMRNTIKIFTFFPITRRRRVWYPLPFPS